MAKYGQTTYTRLDHMVRQQGLTTVVQLNQEDLERLWEVVQAAEGIETYTNPVHARQRLREALRGLREDAGLALPEQGSLR